MTQQFAGQNQVFGLLPDALDAARPHFAPHCDEAERLAADAQVVLEPLAATLAAHLLHPGQVLGVQEGLCGPAAARLVQDVPLPLVLVEGGGRAGRQVTLEEIVKALVPSGTLTWSFVPGRGLTGQQEAYGDGEESPEPGRHHPRSMPKRTGRP